MKSGKINLFVDSVLLSGVYKKDKCGQIVFTFKLNSTTSTYLSFSNSKENPFVYFDPPVDAIAGTYLAEIQATMKHFPESFRKVSFNVTIFRSTIPPIAD